MQLQAMPQPGDAVLRAAEQVDQGLRHGHVAQHDVLVQGGVAEQHVQELPGIAADGGGCQADADVEQAVAEVGDAFHLADDVGQDSPVIDRGQRHLDALLDGDAPGAGLDLGGGAAHAVGNGETADHAVGSSRASTAVAPDSPRITGLMSMALIRSPSARAADCRLSSRSMKAAKAPGCGQRGLARTRPRLDLATPCSMKARLDGSGKVATSRSASAKMPPRPAISTRPTPSARVTPAIASRPP